MGVRRCSRRLIASGRLERGGGRGRGSIGWYRCVGLVDWAGLDGARLGWAGGDRLYLMTG